MTSIFCCCKRYSNQVVHTNTVTFLQPVLGKYSSKISSQIESTRTKSLKYNSFNSKHLYSIRLTSNCSDDDDDYDDLEDGAPPSDMEVRNNCVGICFKRFFRLNINALSTTHFFNKYFNFCRTTLTKMLATMQ